MVIYLTIYKIFAATKSHIKRTELKQEGKITFLHFIMNSICKVLTDSLCLEPLF